MTITCRNQLKSIQTKNIIISLLLIKKGTCNCVLLIIIKEEIITVAIISSARDKLLEYIYTPF